MDNINMISKEELLKRIQELGFYAVELNLFLDTHPTDAQALRDYQYVLQQSQQLRKIYNQRFGSFMNFAEASVSGNTWEWATQPWPWENKKEV